MVTEKHDIGTVFGVLDTKDNLDSIKTQNLIFEQRFVFGKPVKIVRDSGSTNIMVDRKFVPKYAFTGTVRKFVLADGTTRQADVAKIFIRSRISQG